MEQPATITGILTEILHQWYVRVESASKGAGHFIGKRVCVSPHPRVMHLMRTLSGKRITIQGRLIDDSCIRARDIEEVPR